MGDEIIGDRRKDTLKDVGGIACSILYGQDTRLLISRQTTHALYVAYVPPGVPALLDQVKPANHVVKVDCYVPGCPPEAGAILYALKELLAGRIPVLPSEMMRFD